MEDLDEYGTEKSLAKYLPGLAVSSAQSGIVEGSAHHLRHAWRSVEQIEERLLGNMIKVHVC